MIDLDSLQRQKFLNTQKMITEGIQPSEIYSKPMP
jgi:hypothetical protein